MGKIIVNVIPKDQDARLKAKYPNPPPEASPDDILANVHDPSEVLEVIKSQPQPPVAVIVSNFYPEADQQKIKAAVEGGAPGIPVVVIPQGLDDEQAYKYIQDEKAKAGK
ncbi:hypothetical protein BY996DRAFT_2696832 [Phakopsora pachyrhizi]|nr:hypothetical protein BY996DRAFT_2696832 [Phakopsora pachyrhizi]